MAAHRGRRDVHDLTPEEVATGMAEGWILPVDVRESSETDVAIYPDAYGLPISRFDPAAIPDPEGRGVVRACRSGNRSVTASWMAHYRRSAVRFPSCRRHQAWKVVGLPTES